DMKAPSEASEWVISEFDRSTRECVDARDILGRIGREPIASETQDLFMVYLPEDRLPVAGPIAIELVKRGISVAFSEFEVRDPDERSRAMARGLARHRAGVLLRAPLFKQRGWLVGAGEPRLLLFEDTSHPPEAAASVARWLAGVRTARSEP